MSGKSCLSRLTSLSITARSSIGCMPETSASILLLMHLRYPYSTLKAPNVQGTIDALELCAVGRPKTFLFVSSTAVLDNDYYVRLSDRLCNEGEAGVPEDDDLEGSCKGLGKSRIISHGG